jgi:hypothetical protein
MFGKRASERASLVNSSIEDSEAEFVNEIFLSMASRATSRHSELQFGSEAERSVSLALIEANRRDRHKSLLEKNALSLDAL